MAYLFTRGLNLPGNLISGDISFQAEMDQVRIALFGRASSSFRTQPMYVVGSP